jgi:negative regulator of replication initiation
MARFVGRLVEEIGGSILSKAESFRFGNNRKLVSTDPKRDFPIGNTGRTYQNKEIPGTRHWIMTGIDNDQKKIVLTALLRHLGLGGEMGGIEIIN